ncbi:MAG: sigma-54 dependent transcriptional regulator [Alphaproteobacteria bacterium]|nr:sigma-54 dependent transcriptional regulator [Alphaproteobacteria bacterium]
MTGLDNLLVGQSGPMREIKRLIELAAPSTTTLLVQGETGTGKELVAQAVHSLSGRSGQLISVNCSAIPSELLESELFGHEKGAFTGADKLRAGRFELADGGTLFLDEIGDMPLSLQAKLLRALESRTIQRVGGSKEIEVDFRLVCATHQNIEADIETGKFRADLFYRINVFPLTMPALAARAVDIPILVDAIIKRIKNENNKANIPDFKDSAMSELMRYPWPGNVRELRNVIERAFLLYPGRSIENNDVRNNLLRIKAPDPLEEQEALWLASADFTQVDQEEETTSPPLPHPSHYQDWFSYFNNIDLRRHLQDVEIVLIEAALKRSEGMISSAAEALKLNRTTLIEKMKKYLIEKPEKGG